MTKNFIIVLLLITGALIFMYLFIGVPKVYREEILEDRMVHMFNNPSRSIEEISILAFYFVPKDKVDRMVGDWKELLNEELEKIEKFHALQFQDKSKINYSIFSHPVIGLNESIIYDTTITQGGNPEALRSVTVEIEERALNSSGDLYVNDFPIYKSFDNIELPYQAILIMYEGVGASGGGNAALITSSYLADPRFAAYGETIFVHEFYHTLGIPDAYEVPSNVPFSSDIMGLGRFRPLNKTYLDRGTLTNLGI